MLNTLHKTFNRQAEYIGTGNVLGTCQVSNYLRSANTLECNGIVNPLKKLQDFDISHFRGLPQNVERLARKVADDAYLAILYKIRHWRGKVEIIDGWIITEGSYKLRYIVAANRATFKQRNILQVVSKIISK